MWAIVKKDLAVLLRRPVALIVTIVPALVLVLVLLLEAGAVGSYPVAVVNLDPGGAAASTLVGDALGYNGFRARTMTAAAAEAAFGRLQVAAVLTVPAGFSAALAAGLHPAVTWQVRNFNLDSTNDLRRGLPDVLSAFLRSGAAGPDPVKVALRETDLHAHEPSLVAYQLVPVLALLLLQAGVVNAGLGAVAEWQTGSVKELLLSPVPAGAVVAGKVTAGVLAAMAVGLVAVGAGLAAGLLVPPPPAQAALTLAAMFLLATFAAGLGVAIAAGLRIQDHVVPVSINLAFYLFFLGGGITALAYLPEWLHGVARAMPLTYATALLRGALLYGSDPAAGRRILVLALFAVGGVAAGIPALRRGIAH